MNILKKLTPFLIVLVFCNCEMFKKIQAERQKVLEKVREVCESIPVPDSITKTDSGSLIKPDRGGYSIDFVTELDCKEARKPFYKYLSEQGWQPTEKNLGYYYKDNFVFNVTCQAQAYPLKKNRLQASCGWDKNGEDKNFY